MMHERAIHATSGGPLRLVGGGQSGSIGNGAAARRAIAAENTAAANLPADDARLVMAARVAGSLDGGRAAILTPDKRRKLVAMGTNLGLRSFDTNLIIAIVQDGARRGEMFTGASTDADRQRQASVLAMVGSPRRDVGATARIWLAPAAGAVLAAAFTIALIRWLLSG